MYVKLKAHQSKKKRKKELQFSIQDSPDNETRRQIEFIMGKVNEEAGDDEVISAKEIQRMISPDNAASLDIETENYSRLGQEKKRKKVLTPTNKFIKRPAAYLAKVANQENSPSERLVTETDVLDVKPKETSKPKHTKSASQLPQIKGAG